MKRKFTEAKKANRPSAFHKTQSTSHSIKRAYFRGSDKKPKTFGFQILYTQAISLKAYVTIGMFHRIIKNIKHPRVAIRYK